MLELSRPEEHMRRKGRSFQMGADWKIRACMYIENLRFSALTFSNANIVWFDAVTRYYLLWCTFIPGEVSHLIKFKYS